MTALAPEARKPAIRILFITIFLDLLGFGLILPQLPFYAAKCGAGGTVIGLVASVYSLLQFLMAPFWGRLSDRIGRRPIILIGLCGAGVSYVVFGSALRLAAITGLSPIPFLVLSRGLAGFFNANVAAAQAYMADVTPGADRAAAMGLVGAAFGLGFVLGPVVSGGIWMWTGSAELPFYVAAACEFATFLWALRALPEPHEVSDKTSDAAPKERRLALADLPAGPLRLVMVLWFLGSFSVASMENTLGLFVMDSPELRYTSVGFAKLLLFLGLAAVVTQGFAVKRLAKRFRERQLLTAGALGMVVGLGLTPWVTTSFEIYALMGLVCFGYGLVNPSLSSMASLLAPEAVRGEVLGVGQSMASLGRIVGPIVAGWLYQAVSHGATYVCGAALALAAAALAQFLTVPPP